MAMTTEKLILAVPKGRILGELLPVLKQVDIIPEDAFFDEKDRSLRFATNHGWLDMIRVRSFDVATLVAYGGAQLGVAGGDVLAEFDYDGIYAPIDLNLGHCRLSLAQPESLKEDVLSQHYSHIRVATKYPKLTRAFFADRGIQAECIKLNGAMELAPSLGLCDYIVDLVSSGATLKANGLHEVKEIMNVSSRLIVNRAAAKVMGERIRPLVKAFEGAIYGKMV